MARVLAVLVFGLLCAAAAMAQQLNCANLEGNSSAPIVGTNLPYCQNRSLQCCTAQYFMRREMEINDSIIDNLRDELAGDENTVAFMNLQETLERFVDNDFTNAFIRDLPGLGILPAAAMSAREIFVNKSAMMLRNNFRINSTNQFNLTMYFRQLTMDLNTLFIQGISMLVQTQLNANQTTCVRMQINDAINQTAINRLINRIGQLRRVSTTLFRIIQWYRYTFLQRLAGFRPLQQCVARFITLRCAACNTNIPMLCRPRCNALVRGCLSSFNQGLRDQYEILWNVTRQVVRRGSAILEEIGSEERDFLTVDISSMSGFGQFVLTVGQRCGIGSPSPGRKRRQTNNMFRPPNAVMGNATRLMGSIRFGNNGPRFCRNNPVTNCWNGMRVVNRDDINFTRDDISDQANNPVESFNVDELNAQAIALGIPMSEFFMSAEYMETAPEDVVVPRGEAYSPPPSSGASFIKAAPILLVLLFAALVALF